MVKYLKQPTLSSCGPVSVVNLGKHLGKPLSSKDIKKWCKICGTDRDGTDAKGVSKGLKALGVRYKYSDKMTKKELDAALDKAPVILGYCRIVKTKVNTILEGHFILITKKTKTTYEVINYVSDKDYLKVDKFNRPYFMKTRARISHKTMVKYLKPLKLEGTLYYPDIWTKR